MPRTTSDQKNKQTKSRIPPCLQASIGPGWGPTETQRGIVDLNTKFSPVNHATCPASSCLLSSASRSCQTILGLPGFTRLAATWPSALDGSRGLRGDSLLFSLSTLRFPLASCSVLCQEASNLFARWHTPLYHRARLSFWAAVVHRTIAIPNVARFSSMDPLAAPKAFRSSIGHFSQSCTGRPVPGSSCPATFPNMNRFGESPLGLSRDGSRKQQSSLAYGCNNA